MAKKTPVQVGSNRHRKLQAKHAKVDAFARTTEDRERSFEFALRLALPADEVAKAMARNFNLKGEYDPMEKA